MKMASLYVEKESALHRTHPINKLYYIMAAVLIPLFISNLYVTVGVILINLTLLSKGRVFRRMLPLIGVSLILMASILLVQGLFNPDNETVLLDVMGIRYYLEGFLHALSICLNLINIICAFSILVLTTRPSDLVESLVKKGMSPKIGYVFSSVLQIIPEMITSTGTITDAQRSRGLEMEGRLLTRVKAFIPLIGPVVMNSLLQTRERAVALEVRGFNSRTPKTFINQMEDGSHDRFIRSCCCVLVIAALVWRGFLWLR